MITQPKHIYTQLKMSDISNEKQNPLRQFKIEKIFDIQIAGIDISLTNSSVYMFIATILAIVFMIFATSKKSLIPSKLQLIAEITYNFVANMVKTSIGNEGNKFFPLIFSLFIFILLCNILGMTPYSFTVTSHIVVTLALSMVAFLTITIFAITRNGFKGFLHMFLPSGVPLVMAPLIFMIELFSYLIRPVTLSVRLFANIVAGHVLLKVIAGFIISLGLVFGWAPMIFAVIMTGFELFVAILQSYIFAVLVCAYLGDAIRQH
jgi:F-type H+-transporting ATPase subunit a